jgi:hypothetical protein
MYNKIISPRAWKFLFVYSRSEYGIFPSVGGRGGGPVEISSPPTTRHTGFLFCGLCDKKRMLSSTVLFDYFSVKYLIGS